ncbi:hypothetical protein AA18890_2821 [Komagataeibacter europaeus LMG 18890]|nr:hypothetical protein AA18890_2821 [Komagataeibacter europaeus LMG 18890]
MLGHARGNNRDTDTNVLLALVHFQIKNPSRLLRRARSLRCAVDWQVPGGIMQMTDICLPTCPESLKHTKPATIS